MSYKSISLRHIFNAPAIALIERIFVALFAFAACICGCLSIAIAFWTIGQGFDLSDEAFNYLLIRDTDSISFALRFQGFLLAPFDMLIGGSLIGMRVFSLLIYIALFTAFAWYILVKSQPKNHDARHQIWVLALILISAATAFGWDRLWFLRVPTYITVATWGSIIYLTGLVFLTKAMAKQDSQKSLLIAATLLVLGIFFAGLARPPSGLLLALISFCVALFYILKGQDQRRYILYLIGYGICVAIIFIMVLSAAGFTPFRAIDLWQTAIELRSKFINAQPFLTKHMSDMLSLYKVRPDVVQLLLWSLICLAWTFVYMSKPVPKIKFLMWPAVAFSLVLTGYGIYRLSPIGLANYYHRPTFAAEIFAFALSWVAFATAFHVWWNDRWPQYFLIAVGCLLAPLIVVFGTGSTVYVQIINSISPLALSIILITVAARQRLMIVFACLCVTGLALQIQTLGMDKPYRVFGKVSEMTEAVTLPNETGTLYEHPQTATFYKKFQDAAADREMAIGTPLVDLTGRRPGFALILPANAPTYPWIASGYVNSPDLLDFIWSHMLQSDRERGWILGPLHKSFDNGPDGASFDDLAHCYQQVVSAIEPRVNEAVELWKPRDDRSLSDGCFG